MDGPGGADAKRTGIVLAGVEADLDVAAARAPLRGLVCEQAGELAAQLRDHCRVSLWLDVVQDELAHPYLDVRAHAPNPASSPADRGRWSLAYSVRAACSTCAMPTGVPACAALNAALSATVRMLPPAMLRRASAS